MKLFLRSRSFLGTNQKLSPTKDKFFTPFPHAKLFVISGGPPYPFMILEQK